MAKDVQPIFRGLADPTRRAILATLAAKPATVGSLVDLFDVSRPAVAKHLKILEEGGLIRTRRMGRERMNYLRPETLRLAAEWLSYFDRFWDEKLDRLKTVIEGETP